MSGFVGERRWLWATLACSAPAALSCAETYFFMHAGGMPVGWGRVVLSQAPPWGIWLPAIPLLFALSERLPLRRPLRLRALAAHLGAGLGLAIAFGAASMGINQLFPLRPQPGAPGEVLLKNIIGWSATVALTYAVVVGVASALGYARLAREREQRASALTAELARAQLQALQSQLQPHFLFNTLNAVVTLVREHENDSAARMLVLLGDILRRLLRHSEHQLVPLREELVFLEKYLEIQQVRFGDRLRVHWEVPSTSTVHDAVVPQLLLQPLAENAIRHGLSRRRGPGELRIRAVAGAGVLELIVEDDGAGLAPGFDPATTAGVGLANTRARLRQLYGGEASLALSNREGGGARAVVRLPQRGASEVAHGGADPRAVGG